jgi:subtilisin-like proprotein convertase family protein
MRTLLQLTSLLAILTSASLAWAVPTNVQVAGAITNTGGGAAPDGGYKLTFTLYAAEDSPVAEWSEGPVVAVVKNGQFGYQLGSTKPLPPGLFSKLDKPWLAVQIEGDPELPRKPIGSVMFALKAGLAEGIDCSGCIGAKQLDPQVFAGLAKSTDLAGYAKAADLGDYAKTSELGAFAKLDGLAKVALTGKAEDLIGAAAIDLTGYTKSKDLANVAFSGKYADLSGAPSLGQTCGTGLVVTGIELNGTLKCAAALDPKSLPADTLEKISAGVLSNFIQTKVVSATLPKDVPDNNPVGVGDFIEVGDIGNVLSVSVHAVVANSDFTKLKMTLQDPAGVVYTLTESNDAKGKLDTTWPEPTPVAKGDLGTLAGKNPKGKWLLTVVDTGFLNNAKDGQLLAWDLAFKTQSSTQVQVKGGGLIDGNGWPYGRVAKATSDALANDGKLTVATGGASAVLAQGWLYDAQNKLWVAANTGTASVAGCTACGSGKDGDFNATGDTTLTGGTYEFKTFTIKAGVTVKVAGGNPLMIKVQGAAQIDGTLDLRGGNAPDVNSCCPDAPGGAGGGGGGANGATGPGGGGAANGGGPGGGGGGCASGYGAGGGGAGHATNGDGGTTSPNSCGPGGGGGGAYGNGQFSGGVEPGSGGGSGGYGSAANSAGSGGGGGGGAVQLVAGKITVSGTGAILADGGNGGAVVADRDGGAGGGGSGGGIWLRATTVVIGGAVTAKGGAGGKSDKLNGYGGDGGNGAAGRIVVDSVAAVQGNTTPAYASANTTGLDIIGANKFALTNDGAGNVTLINQSGTTQKVMLVVSW